MKKKSTAASERQPPWRFKLFPYLPIALTLLVFALIVFTLKTNATSEALYSLDNELMLSLAKLRTPGLNEIFIQLTALGSLTVMSLLTTVATVLFWLGRDRLSAAHMLCASIGAWVLIRVVKNIVGRERPTLIPRLVDVDGLSFPSGHSLATAAIYGTLFFLTARHYPSHRAKSVLFLMCLCIALLVSFSRVYVGVHFPSDVTAGLSLGAAWACFLIIPSETLKRKYGLTAKPR